MDSINGRLRSDSNESLDTIALEEDPITNCSADKDNYPLARKENSYIELGEGQIKVSLVSLTRLLIIGRNAIYNKKIPQTLKHICYAALTLGSLINSFLTIFETVIRFTILFFSSPLLFFLLSKDEKVKSVGNFALKMLIPLAISSMHVVGSAVDGMHMHSKVSVQGIPSSIAFYNYSRLNSKNISK